MGRRQQGSWKHGDSTRTHEPSKRQHRKAAADDSWLLTTFSIANDVAKYFAILPAAFAATYPVLKSLDLMRMSSPSNAILAAVIFNALIIIVLVPLALKGVRYRPVGAAQLLRNNLLIYGLGGLIVPFLGIKAIDMLLSAVGLA